jgi:hypothetical protein
MHEQNTDAKIPWEIAVREPAHTTKNPSPENETRTECKKSHSPEISAQLLALKTCSFPPMQKQNSTESQTLSIPSARFGWKIQFFILIFFSFYKTPILHFPVHT